MEASYLPPQRERSQLVVVPEVWQARSRLLAVDLVVEFVTVTGGFSSP